MGDTSTFYRVSYLTVAPAIRTMWRVKTTGKEHIPSDGAAIFASNHLSFLDHFVLPMATPRQIYFISKVQHFENPIKRFLFERWGVIPLRRGESDEGAFEQAVRTIRSGNLFCIYPEGTRSLDGKLHRGHTGVARMALLTGAPVLPTAMVGTFEALPKGKNVPRLSRCEVRIGEPLRYEKNEAKAKDRAELRRITDEIMAAIAAVSGQEYVDEYQRNPEYRSSAHGYGQPAGTGDAEGGDGSGIDRAATDQDPDRPHRTGTSRDRA